MENNIVISNPQPTSSLSLLAELPAVLRQVCVAASKPQTLAEVVADKKAPKIGQLQKEVEPNDMLKVIRAMLVKLNNDLHIDNGLTNDNIRSISKRLTTDSELRWWLTLADISLLCRQITSGHFGHFYNHFSELEFMECLSKYCAERNDIHFTNADKTVTNPSDATLKMSELGYSLGPDGQLIVPEEAKERRLAQPLYLYNDNGKRIGINPKGAFGKNQAAVSDTNNVMFLVKKMMKADRNLDLDDAIDRAKEQLNQATNTSSNEHQTTTAQ